MKILSNDKFLHILEPSPQDSAAVSAILENILKMAKVIGPQGDVWKKFLLKISRFSFIIRKQRKTN
uniref:Uncharacterized protein n=1 Tax=Romanomermis culicivorax TaxID=13658 RepID=A0A915L4T0_ROMCU